MCDCGECDCCNRSKYEPCGDNLACCEHCPDGAPCAYAFVSACRWKHNGLFANLITVLWKECLFDCIWTARRCKEFAVGGVYLEAGCGDEPIDPLSRVETSLGELFPMPGVAETDDGDYVTQISPPIAIEEPGTLHGTRLKFGCVGMPITQTPFDVSHASYSYRVRIGYRCGWYDFWDGFFIVDNGNTALTNGQTYSRLELFELGYAPMTANFSCTPDARQAELEATTEIAWKLEVTGPTTAVLTGYDDTNTPVVVYNCDNWQCVPELDPDEDGSHGNTFVMEDYPNPDFPQLEPRICLVPYSADWHTHCEAPADACACGDAGWNNISLEIGGLECSNRILDDDGCIQLLRHKADVFDAVDDGNSGTLDLSGHISPPDPAPCGYFLTSLEPVCTGESDHTKLLVFVAWCDGSDWKIKIYCVIHAGATVSSVTTICDSTMTVSQICPDGARFSFTCDASASGCCEECPPPGTIDTDCCPDDLIPETLTGELSPDPSNPTACTGYDQSGSLTHSTTGAGPTLQHFWSGTITDCGTTYYVKITCDGGTWKAKVWEPAGTCMGETSEGAATYITASSASCDPFELVFAPFDSSIGGCSCCPGSAPKGFQLTVTA